MNREIKFRIWLKEKKQMIQDVHICSEYGWLVMSDNDTLEEICGRISEKELIWMQYTGLKDKNGVEVYEGDKVMHDYEWTEPDEIGIITWNKDTASFQIKGHIPSSSMKHLDRMKVTGNIYENEVD